MRTTNDAIEELLDEVGFNYKRASSVYSLRVVLDDLFRNKREFVLIIDATRKNKIIIESYIDNNTHVLNPEQLMRNLNLLNKKSTIGKFVYDTDGHVKYIVSFEFNLIVHLFNATDVKKRLLHNALERVVVFFDNNFNSFKDLPQYVESIPDFTFNRE